MFVFNWFKPQVSQQVETKEIKEITNSELCIIKREDYEALLSRLQNLEAMMRVLPPNPPKQLPTRTCACEELNTPEQCSKKELNPFQLELERKLNKIRSKMGESHGWDNNGLNNLDDLNKLEQSVMERSLLLSKRHSFGTSNSEQQLPAVEHIDEQQLCNKRMSIPNLLNPKCNNNTTIVVPPNTPIV